MPEEASQPWQVTRLLEWTKNYFARASLDKPRLTAEMLLAKSLQCERLDLYTRFDYTPTKSELKTFRKLLLRAIAHEPPAYLVGHKEFYSLEIKVTADVLIPRPETEILVEQAIGHVRKLTRGPVVWDTCTGSGCVAVAIAANVVGAHVLATDISPEALAVARENVSAHGLDARVTCCLADLLTLPAEAAVDLFDVITANPPYVATGDPVADTVRHEPSAALYAGETGLDFIERIVNDAPGHLRAGGLLVMEFGIDQADDVRDMIVRSGAFAEPTIHHDHQGLERTAAAIRLAHQG